MMALGVPEPRVSLLDRIRQLSNVGGRGPTSDPQDRTRDGAAYSVDTGGLSGGQAPGPSPISQSGYDGYDPATRFASNAVTMRPSRLIQRINPVSSNRGGTRKEYEGGGP